METNYFWYTEYTMPIGAPGFSHFCPGHLGWLFLTAALCLGLGVLYRRWQPESRLICCRIIAGILVADELFKYYLAFRNGGFRPAYLPLHLCSINIFVIAADAIRPS